MYFLFFECIFCLSVDLRINPSNNVTIPQQGVDIAWASIQVKVRTTSL
jgi:hypothetical protein